LTEGRTQRSAPTGELFNDGLFKPQKTCH